MASKSKKKPLTDAQRLERFKAMGREVEASDKPEAFDKAFKDVVQKPKAVSKQK